MGGKLSRLPESWILSSVAAFCVARQLFLLLGNAEKRRTSAIIAAPFGDGPVLLGLHAIIFWGTRHDASY